MLVLITYDVSTQTPEGRRRLRQVAKCCVRYGQRVQNSVFECNLDAAQLKRFQSELESQIDRQADSLRFYLLGNHYQNKVTHVGAKRSYDPEGLMML